MIQIPINEIKIEERLRDTKDKEHINTLINSIESSGLYQPIIINKDNVLVSGYYRLQACKMLGHKTIDCQIVKYDKKQNELIQIEENLIRKDLSALEKIYHITQQKNLYESLGYTSTTKSISELNNQTERMTQKQNKAGKILKSNDKLAKKLQILDKTDGTLSQKNIEDICKSIETKKKISNGELTSISSVKDSLKNEYNETLSDSYLEEVENFFNTYTQKVYDCINTKNIKKLQKTLREIESFTRCKSN